MCVSEIITEFERCFAFSRLGLDNKKSQQNTTEHNRTSSFTQACRLRVFFSYTPQLLWRYAGLLVSFPRNMKTETKLLISKFKATSKASWMRVWHSSATISTFKHQNLLNIKICLLFFKQQCLFFKNNLYFQKSARLWWWSSLSAYLTRGLHPSKWDHRCYNKLHKQQAVIQLNSDHCQWNGNQKRPLSKNFFISLTIT